MYTEENKGVKVSPIGFYHHQPIFMGVQKGKDV